MLTKLTIRNFKRFGEVEIELGNPVVFVGPNNSGKTTALQALALWDFGVKQWYSRRGSGTTAKERTGVTVNRKDLIATPVPVAEVLWRNLRTTKGGKQVKIDIVVSGTTTGTEWQYGVEFERINEESLRCGPSESCEGVMFPPEGARVLELAYLQPMSGLALVEPRYDRGRINVLIGEGRTAEVLRNLCYQVFTNGNGQTEWHVLNKRIEELFKAELMEPEYDAIRGEIYMTYRNTSGRAGNVSLDLSTAGRGFQQILLLLAYMTLNRNSVLLLDEPDAHLEILRQREIYDVITEMARERNSQVIIASHSEVVMDQAVNRPGDKVVAFLGKPHRVDDKGKQLKKSLNTIRFDHYLQAEQTGWVLYLEGSTDRSMLKAFADKLQHDARRHLERPFVEYVGNDPRKAWNHFDALREAKPDLRGLLICDHDVREPIASGALTEHRWARREIENYFAFPETLLRYAESLQQDATEPSLFDNRSYREIMEQCVKDNLSPAAYRDPQDQWWTTAKVSDDFLDRVLRAFAEHAGVPLLYKRDYYSLIQFLPEDRLDPEIKEVLDLIASTANEAHAEEEESPE